MKPTPLDPLVGLGAVSPNCTTSPASKVDMLLGSCATGLASAGGFCAGSRTVVDHQRINGPSFVFSASMPALLAVSASEGINILRSTPSIFETLQDNIRAAPRHPRPHRLHHRPPRTQRHPSSTSSSATRRPPSSPLPHMRRRRKPTTRTQRPSFPPRISGARLSTTQRSGSSRK